MSESPSVAARPWWRQKSLRELVLTLVWCGLMVPTVTLWSQSVLWIGIISVYAIVVTHWGNYLVQRTAERTAAKAGEDAP